MTAILTLQTLAIDELLRGDVKRLLKLPETVVDLSVDRVFAKLKDTVSNDYQEKVEDFRLRVLRGMHITPSEWGIFKFGLRRHAISVEKCENNGDELCIMENLWGRFGVLITRSDCWYTDADLR